MQLKLDNVAIKISILSMIGLIYVKSLYFLCILWMPGYNKQQFVKPYTVKFKILENKYHPIGEYNCVVQY